MISPKLISLPSHILIEITSYLPPPTLKALCQTHQVLREIAEIHLYEKIRLPLLNPYYAVQVRPSDSDSSEVEYRPVKPSLAGALESLGWKEDIHQSGYLDSSLLYLIPLLKGREGYVKELVIDLKDRYHDFDLDLDNLTNPTTPTSSPILDNVTIFQTSSEDRPKPLSDPISELDNLRLHLSLIRQAESPSHIPNLAKTFRSFPILPAVTKVTMTIYESYTGYLPYLLPLLPNLQELIIHPHELLVESSLSFPGLQGIEVSNLKVLRVEPMLDCLRGLVGDWLRDGSVEGLVLGDVRGGRGWTMDERLESAIRGCRSLKRVETGKRASKVMSASRRERVS
jgi:hypothetical protein